MVVDSWRVYQHHLASKHQHKNIKLIDYTSILTKDCLYNDFERTTSDHLEMIIDAQTAMREIQPQIARKDICHPSTCSEPPPIYHKLAKNTTTVKTFIST